MGLSPNQKLAATVSLGAALILTAVVLFFVGVWLGRDLPTDEITTPVRLDHLPRFLMTLAACTPPALASLRLSGRALRD